MLTLEKEEKHVSVMKEGGRYGGRKEERGRRVGGMRRKCEGEREGDGGRRREGGKREIRE